MTGRKLRLLTNQQIPNELGAIIPRGSIGNEIAQLGCGCPGNPFRSRVEFSILDRQATVIIEVKSYDFQVVKEDSVPK